MYYYYYFFVILYSSFVLNTLKIFFEAATGHDSWLILCLAFFVSVAVQSSSWHTIFLFKCMQFSREMWLDNYWDQSHWTSNRTWTMSGSSRPRPKDPIFLKKNYKNYSFYTTNCYFGTILVIVPAIIGGRWVSIRDLRPKDPIFLKKL